MPGKVALVVVSPLLQHDNALASSGEFTSDNSTPSSRTNDNNVSYFVNIDAKDTFPGLPLCGDRHLAVNGVPAPHGVLQISPNSTLTWFGPRHDKSGNIALADGSVQGFASARLGTFLKGNGMATNRLAIP